MIVFVHTKFGLVLIQGSGVKRGGGIRPPPRSEQVFQIPVQIGLNQAVFRNKNSGLLEQVPNITLMSTRQTWARQHWTRKPLTSCPKDQVMRGILKGIPAGDRSVSPEQPAQSKP